MMDEIDAVLAGKRRGVIGFDGGAFGHLDAHPDLIGNLCQPY